MKSETGRYIGTFIIYIYTYIYVYVMLIKLGERGGGGSVIFSCLFVMNDAYTHSLVLGKGVGGMYNICTFIINLR